MIKKKKDKTADYHYAGRQYRPGGQGGIGLLLHPDQGHGE
jgi:hypothetical protein